MATETKEIQAQEVQKEEVQPAEGTERTTTRKAYVPRVDIYETDDRIVLLADVPGVDESSIDITLEKNVLSINGLVENGWPENYTLAYAEYGIGDYQRSFTLSDEVDQEKIQAMVKNGVLRLDLPKAGPVKARKISVKAA